MIIIPRITNVDNNTSWDKIFLLSINGSKIAVNSDILDKHINASETVDNFIASKKHIQCIDITNPINK